MTNSDCGGIKGTSKQVAICAPSFSTVQFGGQDKPWNGVTRAFVEQQHVSVSWIDILFTTPDRRFLGPKTLARVEGFRGLKLSELQSLKYMYPLCIFIYRSCQI